MVHLNPTTIKVILYGYDPIEWSIWVPPRRFEVANSPKKSFGF